MYQLKLTRIGNSVGVVLPKDVLEKLNIHKGDTVFLTDAPGGVMLSPYDPAIEEQLKLGLQDRVEVTRYAIRRGLIEP